MDKQAKNIFFLGKGGVGKSTASALTALHLARQGHETLLVSMDPAHNQSDIFQTRLIEKGMRITAKLTAKEVDIKRWVNKYLHDIQRQVKRSYFYLTAFNLENYLDILKYSPGIEEYALLLAYNQVHKEYSAVDYIIFDMPPTALALKFLTLPDLSLKWLENLLKLRNQILQKKEIVSKVKFGKKEVETDKIKNKLLAQIQHYRKIHDDFRNPSKTALNLVVNTDRLSFSESRLITERLNEYGLHISGVFLNKYHDGFDLSNIKNSFRVQSIRVFPESNQALLGLDALQNYLNSLDGFTDL